MIFFITSCPMPHSSRHYNKRSIIRFLQEYRYTIRFRIHSIPHDALLMCVISHLILLVAGFLLHIVFSFADRGMVKLLAWISFFSLTWYFLGFQSCWLSFLYLPWSNPCSYNCKYAGSCQGIDTKQHWWKCHHVLGTFIWEEVEGGWFILLVTLMCLSFA